MNKNTHDLTGKKFGLLTAIKFIPGTQKKGEKIIPSKWICECVCGNTSTVQAGNLRSGNTTSCGCIGIESRKTAIKTHGLRKHPLYNVWNSMRQRCTNPNTKSYKTYGARGIHVCERWLKFENFWEDVSPEWEKGLTLERIDNNGPYGPDNCKWATREKQANNRVTSSFIDTIHGRLTIAEASKISGIKAKTIWMRKYTYKWPDKDLLIPVH